MVRPWAHTGPAGVGDQWASHRRAGGNPSRALCWATSRALGNGDSRDRYLLDWLQPRCLIEALSLAMMALVAVLSAPGGQHRALRDDSRGRVRDGGGSLQAQRLLILPTGSQRRRLVLPRAGGRARQVPGHCSPPLSEHRRGSRIGRAHLVLCARPARSRGMAVRGRSTGRAEHRTARRLSAHEGLRHRPCPGTRWGRHPRDVSSPTLSRFFPPWSGRFISRPVRCGRVPWPPFARGRLRSSLPWCGCWQRSCCFGLPPRPTGVTSV